MDCVCASKNIELLLQTIKSRSLLFDLIAISFFLLGIFLIYNEFLLYLMEKPTYSTHHQTDIQSTHIPTIRVCPQPGLDPNKVTSEGYETLYSYFAGFDSEDEVKFLGWKGNSNSHPLDILEDIAIVKNVANLIESARFYGHDDENIDSNVQLDKAVYPYGQCISLTAPRQMNSVINVEIVFNPKFIKNHKIENVRVFLKDPQFDVKSLSHLLP